MGTRVIGKALGFLAADIILIIGIFVFQFRTDSNIIEKLGNLQITLAETKTEDNTQSLKNSLQLSYNGIVFSADDTNPARILTDSGEDEPAVLLSWKKTGPLSAEFWYSGGVVVTAALDGESPSAQLTVSAALPEGIQDFYLPHSSSYNMKVKEESDDRIVFGDRKNSWALEGNGVASGAVDFTHKNPEAVFALYDDTKVFSFADLAEYASADTSVYESTVAAFRENFMSAFRSSISENTFSEQTVVAYVAAMAEAGKYTQAVEEIPQNFRRSGSRTYLSSPYFNNLVEMNRQLDQAIRNSESQITRSADSPSLDIFTADNIASYFTMYSGASAVRKILERAAASELEDATLAQTAGILRVYAELASLNGTYAGILLPAVDSCVRRIESACTGDGNLVTISENGVFLSVVQGVETGTSLLRAGLVSGNRDAVNAGRVIINSYLAGSASFDIRTLGNLYKLIAWDNQFYPHFCRVDTGNREKIWAWTCASGITYSREGADSMSLTVDFPQNATHYVIFKGIPKFSTIYIYDMQFRTDPRFETYNSSGYVYRNDRETLLLKSRHKSRLENIRFDFKEEAPRQAPAARARPAAPATAETSGAVRSNPVPSSSAPQAEPEKSAGTASSAAPETESAAAEVSSGASSSAPENSVPAPEVPADSSGDAQTSADTARNPRRRNVIVPPAGVPTGPSSQ